ncbi:Translation initiation factor 3 subunit c [Lobulomyces angularis]|nr:Translation initiation factor 3 subunit c [Lobulomyces angularis]
MSKFFQKHNSSSEESESDSDSEKDFKLKAKPQQIKSKLFGKHGSSSDEDSESDADDQSSTHSDQESFREIQETKESGRDRFIKGAEYDSDSSSDDGNKKVLSAIDKKNEELRANIKILNNSKKIGSWVSVQTEFDKITKSFDKSKNLFPEQKPPRYLIRTLVQLDDSLKVSLGEKDKVKKMKALEAKALTAMKQKVKKYIKNYEAEMEAFRENPVEEIDSGPEWSDEEEEKPKEVKKKKSRKALIAAAEDAENLEGWNKIESGKPVVALSMENLFKKLKELMDVRGKKSTDKLVMIKELRTLLNYSKTPYQKCRILLALIPAEFDYTNAAGYMGIELWKTTASDISLIMELLENHTNITVKDGVEEPENDNELDKLAVAGENVELLGNIGSFVDRLDDDFRKSLQHIDPHASEYIDRLKDEQFLYGLIVRSQSYYQSKTEKVEDVLAYGMIMLRRVEHIYFKPENVIKIVESAVKRDNPKFEHLFNENPVDSLCVQLYKTANDRIRTRALLCQVYHHALHNRFYQARDMLLMSHLQETVQQTDVETQILYNRSMVQIGLCAFRLGLIRESVNALQEIQSSGRVKELLAQGISQQNNRYYQNEKTLEQEKSEKLRQLPFHMHINLELMEAVYLTGSMLLEIPNMAQNSHDSRKKVISKNFRRMLDYNERQVFNGPPENTRDHIMGAAKAMAIGEWESAVELISAIKIWDLFPETEKIKEMLEKKIKEESLRTYFFNFSKNFDSILIPQISKMFDLDCEKVLTVLSKMIINEELEASLIESKNLIMFNNSLINSNKLNQSNQQNVNFNKNEFSKLNYLAGVYSEKVFGFCENNEKLFETRLFKDNGGYNQTGGYQNTGNTGSYGYQGKNFNSNKSYGNKPYNSKKNVNF